MSHVHVIGAGLAGLAAALSLTRAGRAVTVHEAGPAAGGRCRSYYDRELDLLIDNGNHLLLSGNDAAFAYIDEIGARHQMPLPRAARFPFIDRRSGARWVVSPNDGRIPWWVLSAARRVPGTGVSDYLALASILRIRDDTPVAAAMRRGTLYSRLVEPLAIAALNTPPQQGLARLLGAVVRETMMRGGHACRPVFPRDGLSGALVDPAVAALRARGAEIRFNRRVSALSQTDSRITGFRAGDETVALAAGDTVVLAVPPWVAATLLPGLLVPDSFEAILNVHFRCDASDGGIGCAAASPGDSGGAASAGAVLGGPDAATFAWREAGFVGVLHGAAEWVFVKRDHVSVTISAANRLVDEPATAIAAMVWPDVCAVLGFRPEATAAMPAYRVVKEKRATFAATAEQEKRRPPQRTALLNLVLAGDWTATGLPATIEGAIRSGRNAAACLLS